MFDYLKNYNFVWNMPNRDRLITIFVVLRRVKVFVYRNTRVSRVIEFVLGGPSIG